MDLLSSVLAKIRSKAQELGKKTTLDERFAEGVERVKSTPLKQFFFPTAQGTAPEVFRQYIGETARELPLIAKSAIRSAPPLQAIDVLRGKQPQNPVEPLLRMANVVYRSSPAAPFLGAAFGGMKGFVESGRKTGAILPGAIKGISEQPFIGEVIKPQNPTAAQAINLAVLPLTLIAGGVKAKFDAEKILASEKEILNFQKRYRNYDYLPNAAEQMKVFDEARELAKKFLPGFLKSREVNRIANQNPMEWLRLVDIYIGDLYYKAKHPEMNLGFSTSAIKREATTQQPRLKVKPKKTISTMGEDLATSSQGVEQTARELFPLAAKATKGEKLSEQLLAGRPPMGGGQQIPPSSGIITDPVQKIIDALREAKPLRGKQEKIYSQIRSQQAGAVAGIGGEMGGEQTFFKQLGALKGEMPKVTFESIRSKITQSDIDFLFNKIEESNLTPFEKVTAKSGLARLLGAEGGAVPQKSQLELLNQVFPPEFIRAVLDKRPLMERLWSTAGSLLNLPRAMMATADMSAPLRQGIFLIGRPKQWLPAFRDMFKYFFSEKAYEGLMENIQSRPTYQVMRESKLAITDLSPILQNREEAFLSNLSEKIPGLGKLARASNRAYSGFLNKLRADVFDDLYKNAKSLGLLEERPQIADDIAKFVNSATGRGDLGTLGRASIFLNGAFFSPRLMASRLNLLNPVYYARLDPFVRKEALKSLFTFAGTGLTVLTLAKLGGLEVGADPRSADFGKIKVGNTRHDIWGGFQQYIKLAAQLITGKLISSTTGKEYTLGEGYKPLTRLGIIGRFIESKEAPILSFATQLLQGQNAVGQPFNVPSELLNRAIPMVVQDIYDLAKERGSILQGIVGGVPGIFGVGVQTYGTQIPTLEKTGAGSPTVKLIPQTGLAEDIINKITGKEPSNIPQSEWSSLVAAKQKESMSKYEKEKLKKDILAGKEVKIENYIPIVSGDEVKILDLSKIAPQENETEFQKALRLKKAFSYVDDILDSDLPIEKQAEYLAKLGISPEDASYYNVARQSEDIKSIWVKDEISKYGDNRQEMLLALAQMRKEVNRKMILENKVIDILVEDEILSKEEGDYLKKLKVDKDGNIKIKLTGRGKSAKIKVPKIGTQKFKFKTQTPRLKPIKVGGIRKVNRGTVFKVRSVKYK